MGVSGGDLCSGEISRGAEDCPWSCPACVPDYRIPTLHVHLQLFRTPRLTHRETNRQTGRHIHTPTERKRERKSFLPDAVSSAQPA